MAGRRLRAGSPLVHGQPRRRGGDRFPAGIPRGASPTPAAVRTEQAVAQAGPLLALRHPVRRERQARGHAWGLRPNTNLEEASDWLTRSSSAPRPGASAGRRRSFTRSAQCGRGDGRRFRRRPTSRWPPRSWWIRHRGFFGGYIYTRLFLQGAFARSDEDMMGSSARRSSRCCNTPRWKPGKRGRRVPRHRRHSSRPPPRRSSAWLRTIRAPRWNRCPSSREYEQTRATMPSAASAPGACRRSSRA